jgi:acetolactate synthase-1/2/3 large subunit
MTVGELATAMRLDLHLVVVLITDYNLSLIRLKQTKKSYSHYGTGLFGEWYTPNKSIFGVPVLTASTVEEYRMVLEKAFSAQGPVIVEVLVDPDEYDQLLLRGNS